mmetsp:Transcript_25606/g.59707  ORF Transcript_25606/g.59707 Transcript_25606/m.59707 type:complete len:215 (-) Transcript_25606:989-1633(-)
MGLSCWDRIRSGALRMTSPLKCRSACNSSSNRINWGPSAAAKLLPTCAPMQQSTSVLNKKSVGTPGQDASRASTCSAVILTCGSGNSASPSSVSCIAWSRKTSNVSCSESAHISTAYKSAAQTTPCVRVVLAEDMSSSAPWRAHLNTLSRALSPPERNCSHKTLSPPGSSSSPSSRARSRSLKAASTSWTPTSSVSDSSCVVMPRRVSSADAPR